MISLPALEGFPPAKPSVINSIPGIKRVIKQRPNDDGHCRARREDRVQPIIKLHPTKYNVFHSD